jgi:F-type H+-transporting ATPase subunit a
MPITPDQAVFWSWHFVHLNATILYTWMVMLLLTLCSWLATRNLDDVDWPHSRWQNMLELMVQLIRKQIREICVQERGDAYVPFIGTLFLFIALSNVLAVVPGWSPPTGSLSTTAALAICVAVAVPVFGVSRQGVVGYFRRYVQPTFLLLPFLVISEMSRTLALAVRLFGNIMSGTMIVGILLAIAPFFFPVLMQLLGLLTGLIQAYIFAVLAMVYIAAAVQSEQIQSNKSEQIRGGK